MLTQYKQHVEEMRYRMYVTDALKLIAENTAKVVGGSYISERWFRKKEEPQQSGDEIARDIIRRADLHLKEGG